MKTIKSLTTAALLLFAGSAFGQDSTIVIKKTAPKPRIEIVANERNYSYIQNSTDTIFKQRSGRGTTITYYGKSAAKAYSRPNSRNTWNWDEGHYMGGSVNYNGLTGLEGTAFEQDTKSIGVDINLIDFVLFSYRSFGIFTGLSIESNNFRFRNSISLKVDENNVAVPDFQYRDAGITLDKSKLTTTYLNVPLLFEFRLGNRSNGHNSTWNNGWVNFGAVVGLRLQSYTKVKLPDGTKIKNFDDFNLRNIHWGAMVGFGYGPLAFTAKYYPQSIFRKGEGPATEQFSFGIGFMF